VEILAQLTTLNDFERSFLVYQKN